jgi:hypothetical protein
MPHRKPEINGRGARRLSLPELEQRILTYLRAAQYHHFNRQEWAAIDSLRKLRTARRKEGGI